MHLADGTLANQVCTFTAVVTACAVAFAARRAYAHAQPRHLIRAAAGAAIVLAAQTIDVRWFGAMPVHVVGAAFLVALAGPALALLAMTAVLVVQALALHDGGVGALGANVFNLGVVGVSVSAVCLASVRGRVAGPGARLVGVALASAASMIAALTAMAAELALSGVSRDVFAAAMAAHAPFALFETAVTPVMVALLAAWHARSGELRVDPVEK